MVENSGRCNKNDCDEKVGNLGSAIQLLLFCFHKSLPQYLFFFGSQIVPNGTAWIPNLVKTVADVVGNGSKGILVDKKLIEGPNPNQRGKLLIPIILAIQVSF